MKRVGGLIWPAITFALAGAIPIVGCATQGAYVVNQPNMQQALAQLQDARNWLERAEHNKGGWRVLAVRLVDQAMNDVRNGMAYADTH
jgi:hypothetical protein